MGWWCFETPLVFLFWFCLFLLLIACSESQAAFDEKRRAISEDLPAEAVKGAALSLERVDRVHGGHGLAARVLGVGHGVADDVLEEHLQHTAGLLVDEARDALDTTTARQAADRGLRDACGCDCRCVDVLRVSE